MRDCRVLHVVDGKQLDGARQPHRPVFRHADVPLLGRRIQPPRQLRRVGAGGALRNAGCHICRSLRIRGRVRPPARDSLGTRILQPGAARGPEARVSRSRRTGAAPDRLVCAGSLERDGRLRNVQGRARARRSSAHRTPPRLLCVQQETCSPMARAFEEGSEAILPHHVVPRPHGIASAILRGNPSRVYPIVRRIVIESEGGFATVSETEIREARRMAEELEGLSLCFSSAAALAGMAKLARRGGIAANQTVLVNLTGRDRDAAVQCHSASWLRRSGDTWIQEGD
ncbi:MAG: pyridoxal-phosphate dependent enzyme [Blastocatellia bacterium]|nr:pyridoxal-phosphate dependent enzyme [Blastocatellia bacterium]